MNKQREFCLSKRHWSRPRQQPLISLQLRELRLGLLQEGSGGVGVFPEGEEVLVSSFCFSSVA